MASLFVCCPVESSLRRIRVALHSIQLFLANLEIIKVLQNQKNQFSSRPIIKCTQDCIIMEVFRRTRCRRRRHSPQVINSFVFGDVAHSILDQKIKSVNSHRNCYVCVRQAMFCFSDCNQTSFIPPSKGNFCLSSGCDFFYHHLIPNPTIATSSQLLFFDLSQFLTSKHISILSYHTA